MGKLVEEARLPDTSLANDRDDLAVPACREPLGVPELVEFGVPPNEPRQPATGGGLQMGTRRACSGHLVHIRAGSASPFTGTGPSSFTAT